MLGYNNNAGVSNYSVGSYQRDSGILGRVATGFGLGAAGLVGLLLVGSTSAHADWRKDVFGDRSPGYERPARVNAPGTTASKTQYVKPAKVKAVSAKRDYNAPQQVSNSDYKAPAAATIEKQVQYQTTDGMLKKKAAGTASRSNGSCSYLMVGMTHRGDRFRFKRILYPASGATKQGLDRVFGRQGRWDRHSYGFESIVNGLQGHNSPLAYTDSRNPIVGEFKALGKRQGYENAYYKYRTLVREANIIRGKIDSEFGISELTYGTYPCLGPVKTSGRTISISGDNMGIGMRPADSPSPFGSGDFIVHMPKEMYKAARGHRGKMMEAVVRMHQTPDRVQRRLFNDGMSNGTYMPGRPDGIFPAHFERLQTQGFRAEFSIGRGGNFEVNWNNN